MMTVFFQGLLSFFSPCVLPLIPLYLGYLSGGGMDRDRDGRTVYRRGVILRNTVFFVLGISFALFLLGLGFSAAGQFFSRYDKVFNWVCGIIVMLFGLYQLGVFGMLPALAGERRLPLRLDKLHMNPLTALLMGFCFSFSWTPCIGPTLTGVLMMTASAATQTKGYLLIGVYTLGFVIPFLAVGGVTGDNVGEFIKAGAVGVGVGSSLINKAWIENGQYEKITEEAKRMIRNMEK
jgi:cytochrome c-type biogenesis protein